MTKAAAPSAVTVDAYLRSEVILGQDRAGATLVRASIYPLPCSRIHRDARRLRAPTDLNRISALRFRRRADQSLEGA